MMLSMQLTYFSLPFSSLLRLEVVILLSVKIQRGKPSVVLTQTKFKIDLGRKIVKLLKKTHFAGPGA